MSEVVFAALCIKVGTSKQVILRRDVVDINEVFRNQVSAKIGIKMLFSGSFREGFRLEGSDVDLMVWRTKILVIQNLGEDCYCSDVEFPLLCDCSESPPGYTLLKWMLPRNMARLLRQPKSPSFQFIIDVLPPDLFIMNDSIYISSSKWRRLMLPDTLITEHGPCVMRYHNGKEYEIAYCIQSNFWPPSASSWIDRCHVWPPPHIAHDIVGNGCHFVAIGHKLGIHKDNEWRISFSQAEQKLVYSMNHSQFLIYGLLKIFLKEVINHEVDAQDKLLCSYHMKTSIFWAIQKNTMHHWCPKNLLKCFWVCFKLLLKWVYEGVCPNFFIPENNMFLSNIHGEAQQNLFLRLHELYEKGLACLLHSPSISPFLIKLLRLPRSHRQSMSIVYNNLYTNDTNNSSLDAELLKAISDSLSVVLLDLHCCIRCLYTIEHLISSSLTEYQVVWLQKKQAYFLQLTAFALLNRYANKGGNKLLYTADKISCQMLRLATKFGCTFDLLYIVMYYYRTSRYKEALSIIEKLEIKLAQPDMIYNIASVLLGGGESLIARIIQGTIGLISGICYIKELIPEQSVLHTGSTLNISPFLLSYMLKILCSIHTDRIKAHRALNDLRALVHLDDLYVFELHLHKDLSWQILGICQQITGDLESALFSYEQSLRQRKYQYYEIKFVTQMRIQDIRRTMRYRYMP
ncbi:uncharacterized protein LOC134277645 [Saccostrea cucullata]|uniref:uncharacterized protein LOC134277645 n=1 Tax=Saccostrea cuccullata TaxID=36930 RepID=UPI002ED18CA0